MPLWLTAGGAEWAQLWPCPRGRSGRADTAVLGPCPSPGELGHEGALPCGLFRCSVLLLCLWVFPGEAAAFSGDSVVRPRHFSGQVRRAPTWVLGTVSVPTGSPYLKGSASLLARSPLGIQQLQPCPPIPPPPFPPSSHSSPPSLSPHPSLCPPSPSSLPRPPPTLSPVSPPSPPSPSVPPRPFSLSSHPPSPSLSPSSRALSLCLPVYLSSVPLPSPFLCPPTSLPHPPSPFPSASLCPCLSPSVSLSVCPSA